MRTSFGLQALLFGAAAAACTSHRIELEPIEVKPIHLTVDINLKVQRELDQFFAFTEEGAPPDGEEETR